jgi:hypothetical protein
MTDPRSKARFRIMMLIAELQELAEAQIDPAECARVEALLLSTIDALSPKLAQREGVPLIALASPGRA